MTLFTRTQMNEIELLCQKSNFAYIQFVHRFTVDFVGYLSKTLLQLESAHKKIIGIIDSRANVKRTNDNTYTLYHDSMTLAELVRDA